MTHPRRPIIACLLGALAIAGCTTWRPMISGPKLPQTKTVLDQLVVYSDTTLPGKHRLLEELKAQRGTIQRKLNLSPSDEQIFVYLFASADDLRAYTQAHYPIFPDRRAFFVESDTRLTVYAYWGDRVAEDLRHEVAHGYLHSVVPHIPLWIDEGLAEYFEVPRVNNGLNQAHVAEIKLALTDGWQPNLKRLEQLRSAADMAQIDYAEAWAWTYLMLETTPERRQLIQGYLRSLKTGESFEPISSQLRKADENYGRTLVDYVNSLR